MLWECAVWVDHTWATVIIQGRSAFTEPCDVRLLLLLVPAQRPKRKAQFHLWPWHAITLPALHATQPTQCVCVCVSLQHTLESPCLETLSAKKHGGPSCGRERKATKKPWTDKKHLQQQERGVLDISLLPLSASDVCRVCQRGDNNCNKSTVN